MYIFYIVMMGTTTQDVPKIREHLQRHQKGNVPATCKRLPVVLKFYCAFSDKAKAFEFEKYLKSGSGRAFMQKRLL